MKKRGKKGKKSKSLTVVALLGSESDAKETGFFKENADQLRGKGRRPKIPFLNFINKQKELADLYK